MYSLETRIKALAVAGLMAASVAGSTMTAFAEENVRTVESVSVAKEVKVAKGITLDTTEFHFVGTLAGASNDDNNAPRELEFSISGLDSKFNKVKTAVDTALTKEKLAEITPGEYTYVLRESEETKLDDDGYGWTCDTTNYKVRVYVDRDHKVKYTLVKTAYNTASGGYEDEGKKLEVATFSNIYTKKAGSKDDAAALTVTKEVVGDYGDLNRQFEFTVKFVLPETDNRDVSKKGFTAKVGDETVLNVEGSEFTKIEGTENYTVTKDFKLKNGETVEFDNLPAGTTYTIVEKGVAGYTTEAEYVSNGTGMSGLVGDVGEDYTTAELNLGEKKNSVKFTNTYQTITITGVVTHSAPFVIMVGALFVAVGGYVVLKKRIEE